MRYITTLNIHRSSDSCSGSAVAASRGLFAPANFLIDVKRGAPSLNFFFFKKIPPDLFEGT